MRRRPVWLHRTLLEAALALAVVGDVTTAATLYGAIDRTSLSIMDGYRHMIERVHDRCLADLGAERFDEITTAAASLAPERAAVLAEDALAPFIV